jgi:cyclopropane fatty-acyl-phospholipid synthase-like methyltransferase
MKQHHSASSRHDRHGARQPERFNVEKAALMDDPQRFEYLPPSHIISLLKLAPGMLVVDYGTGTGTYAIQIASAHPEVTVVAYDEQPQMLEHLRAKPQAKLSNIRIALPEQVTEFLGRADRVLALNVLHELGDEALKEMRELLAADGIALVIDWNAEIERPYGPPREHTYALSQAVERMETAGFSIERLPALRYHFVFRAMRR